MGVPPSHSLAVCKLVNVQPTSVGKQQLNSSYLADTKRMYDVYAMHALLYACHYPRDAVLTDPNAHQFVALRS